MTYKNWNAGTEETLRKALVCRLALSVNDRPYLVPVCYGYQDDRLYFHSGPGGKKLEMLALNPQVCFEIESDVALLTADAPCRFSMRYSCIIGFGTARRLVSLSDKQRALDVIACHYGAASQVYSEAALRSLELYEIEVESMTCKQSAIGEAPQE